MTETRATEYELAADGLRMNLLKTKAFTFLLPLVLTALALSACGGGGGGSAKVTAQDVAVVGSEHVPASKYNDLLAEEKASMKASGQKFPAAGSTEFQTLKTNIVNLLVQQAELSQEAAKLGIKVAPPEVDKQLTQLKKQYYNGSDTKYRADLKKQGVTDSQVRDQLEEKLLEKKLFNNITKSATATKAEVAAYYAANLSQFQQAATRPVQEILVGKNKQALANQVYEQLKGGASFDTLAKKYSQDPGSKNQGGRFTATKGSDVPEFDAAVFDPKSKTGELLKPVETAQYGWFVIKPVGDIVPAKTKTVTEAEQQIRQQLEQQKQQQIANDWMSKVTKSFCSGKIAYQSGFEPSPDPCTAIATPDQTTT
jgi:parvulin-like peptidyl-prolyl isomerase